MREPAHIVVVGASAGGFQAISALLKTMDNVRDAAIFIVLHLAKKSSGTVLTRLLQKTTTLSCHLAENEQAFHAGNVYIAPPDQHMIIKSGHIDLVKGPAENRWRPSIDVLFRSAAVAYHSKVTGIVLSGMLDDGTAGMLAIKRCGGTCIVQEPGEAEFEDMPANVLQYVDVDFRVPVSDIGYVLDDLFSKPARPPAPIPEDISIEAQMSADMSTSIENLKKIGTRSNYTCPECGGSLWSVGEHGPLKRYRCFTGHVFTEGLLLERQTELLEESLWASIRIMEEKRDLLLSTAGTYEMLENASMARDKSEEAEMMQRHISRLKELTTLIHHPKTEGQGD